MVEDIDPHIIGITESWANTDISDAELGLTGYVMFRKDRIGRRGGGGILYVQKSIQAYEIKLEREADCDEAEIESIIDKFVPFQKQGKRCRKKHLSKEAIRKIVLKQTMWRVYRRTRKEEDYANYKEALNTTTTEIRQSKRSYEQKLACNIKHYSKSCYAYVRSKQNVQDKVGPLEESAGNIQQGFLMAKNLNGYSSSVFTKEDISSLPVADAKFQEAKSYYLCPLVVTPELVAKKIRSNRKKGRGSYFIC